MCLIFIARDVHPHYPLIVAANRDEFHGRPTAPAAYWHDNAAIFAGRDLQAGGTWLGVSTSGRFAAITNFGDAAYVRANAPSRGALVSNFLAEQSTTADYLERVAAVADQYNGFGLLAGDATHMDFFSNTGGAPCTVGKGLHGLSNHLLNTPWFKVERGKLLLAQPLKHDEIRVDEIVRVMTDRTVGADGELPDTGVGRQLERAYSPIFIRAENYGTRCTTVVLLDNGGGLRFVEQSYDHLGNATTRVDIHQQRQQVSTPDARRAP